LNAAQQRLKAAQRLLNTERSEVLEHHKVVLESHTRSEATPTSSFQLLTSENAALSISALSKASALSAPLTI
jgi:hypothetical protein